MAKVKLQKQQTPAFCSCLLFTMFPLDFSFLISPFLLSLLSYPLHSAHPLSYLLILSPLSSLILSALFSLFLLSPLFSSLLSTSLCPLACPPLSSLLYTPPISSLLLLSSPAISSIVSAPLSLLCSSFSSLQVSWRMSVWPVPTRLKLLPARSKIYKVFTYL